MFTEVDLSVEHVLMFVIIVFLLYHLIGSCSCIRDGFSVGIPVENDVNYITTYLGTDKCNPGAWVEERLAFECEVVVEMDKDIIDNNNYIYDLYKKYKKLELDNHNYKIINNKDTIGTLCNCDVTGRQEFDRRFGEDIQNCGSEKNGNMCDCLYSGEVVKDNKTLKTGTCAIVGKYFNGTEIRNPPKFK